MTVRILIGDALAQLRTLPDESVQACVTSPPYYGLRDYGTAKWEGGDAVCDHAPRAQVAGAKTASNGGALRDKPSRVCRCGAIRVDAQIGLERTPDEYVARMVDVFREVRRVLRKDGTLWLNIGDSYAGSGKGGNPEAGKQATNRGSQSVGSLYETGKTAREAAVTNVTRHDFPALGIKPKDLIGVPWLLAFALRADGWYLRSDIIWSKRNPMPESVTDRPTKAHEYVFLLSKSERYFYDADAVAEPVTESTVARLSQDVESQQGSDRVPGKTNGRMKAVGSSKYLDADGNADPMLRTKEGLGGARFQETLRRSVERGTRNRRTVWDITTQPFKESHFATMPPELAETCIKAGCPEGGTVLDPFGGAGTTGLVADRLSRHALLIELNPAYAEMARARIQNDNPMFTQVEVA